MKRLLPVAVLAAVFTVLVSAEEGEMEFPKPTKEHEWLKPVEGEWTTETEINMGTAEPMKTTGTAKGRLIGGFWAMIEVNGPGPGGVPFTGILTVGYAPDKTAYVGTWIDSLTSILWSYKGVVAGKTLTLETRGPGHDGKETNFKESLEIVDADHMTFTSQMEMEGKWVQVLVSKYTRKK